MYCFPAFVLCVLAAGARADNLRVGAFNIQVLGQRKMDDTTVVDVLVKIIRRYDLLLIQEIRDSSATAIDELLAATNRNEPYERQFSMSLSERLGRTNSKEQYAFFYRKGSGLEVVDSYTFNDTLSAEQLSSQTSGEPQKSDTFEREPYIVQFKSANTILGEFVLVGIHVAPDDAVHEIQKLESVFYDVKATLGVPDIMVMGDLNAGCRYVTKSEWETITWRQDPKFDWLLGDDVDTTVKGTSCPYDRFITYGDGWAAGIVPNTPSVYRFDTDTSLGEINQTLAEDISDHYPIEFELKPRTGTVTVGHVYVTLIDRLDQQTLYGVRVPAASETTWYIYALDDTASTKPLAKLRNSRLTETIFLFQLKAIAKESWFESMFVVPVKRQYNGSQGVILIIKVPVETGPATDKPEKVVPKNCLFITAAGLNLLSLRLKRTWCSLLMMRNIDVTLKVFYLDRLIHTLLGSQSVLCWLTLLILTGLVPKPEQYAVTTTTVADSMWWLTLLMRQYSVSDIDLHSITFSLTQMDTCHFILLNEKHSISLKYFTPRPRFEVFEKSLSLILDPSQKTVFNFVNGAISKLKSGDVFVMPLDEFIQML